MANMKIRILGNGGFYNEGLPYNAIAVDGHVLIETPPDILQSLNHSNMRPSQIDTVFISHIHGDHCFGFPFFFFNWLYAGEADSHYEKGSILEIIGPAGLREHLLTLLRLAIPPEHQYIRDFSERVKLFEVDEGDIIAVQGNIWFSFMRTKHSLPTLSLIAGAAIDLPMSPAQALREALFAYSSDTAMFEGIHTLLESGAKLILCDTNGEKESDVHMSPAQLIAAARAHGLEGNSERLLLGTHMSRRILREGKLRFAQGGEEFSLI